MKIFPVSEIKNIDSYTIRHEPIASIDLMERAAQACTNWISKRFTSNRPVAIFCGQGNNGGDGLAIARQLTQLNFVVRVFVLDYHNNWSEDCLKNLRLLEQFKKVKLIRMAAETKLPEIDKNEIVIDAIFGSGLNRPLNGPVSDIIRLINQQSSCTVSIDLPSGLFGEDNSSNNLHQVVHAHFTLSFQFPKLAFFFASNNSAIGEWVILDIGLHPKIIEDTVSGIHYLDQNESSRLRKKRGRFTHKGIFGHALLIAGSKGMAGAALLAGEACTRAGAGLVTLHIPHSLENIMQAGFPEALVSLDPAPNEISIIPDLGSFSSVGIGPGLNRKPETAWALERLLRECKIPLVLDADALNIIGEHKQFLNFIPRGSILTPHPKEFERLFGTSPHDFHRWQKQIEMSEKYGIYILLKGAFSCLATPDGKCWFNSTGNPGMATGGTGDVLTGIITGILASGYDALSAALIGMWIHGKAGDIAVQDSSEEALTAGDLLGKIGSAFSILKPLS